VKLHRTILLKVLYFHSIMLEDDGFVNTLLALPRIAAAMQRPKSLEFISSLPLLNLHLSLRVVASHKLLDGKELIASES